MNDLYVANRLSREVRRHGDAARTARDRWAPCQVIRRDRDCISRRERGSATCFEGDLVEGLGDAQVDLDPLLRKLGLRGRPAGGRVAIDGVHRVIRAAGRGRRSLHQPPLPSQDGSENVELLDRPRCRIHGRLTDPYGSRRLGGEVYGRHAAGVPHPCSDRGWTEVGSIAGDEHRVGARVIARGRSRVQRELVEGAKGEHVDREGLASLRAVAGPAGRRETIESTGGRISGGARGGTGRPTGARQLGLGCGLTVDPQLTHRPGTIVISRGNADEPGELARKIDDDRGGCGIATSCHRPGCVVIGDFHREATWIVGAAPRTGVQDDLIEGLTPLHVHGEGLAGLGAVAGPECSPGVVDGSRWEIGRF